MVKSIVEAYGGGAVKTLNHFIANLPATGRQVFRCRYWYLDSIEQISIDSKSDQGPVLKFANAENTYLGTVYLCPGRCFLCRSF
jgi:hypothetical protein